MKPTDKTGSKLRKRLNRPNYGKQTTGGIYAKKRRPEKYKMEAQTIEYPIQQGSRLIKRRKRTKHRMNMVANVFFQHHRAVAASIEFADIEKDVMEKGEWGGRRMGSKTYLKRTSSWTRDYIGYDVDGPTYAAKKFCHTKKHLRKGEKRFFACSINRRFGAHECWEVGVLEKRRM